MCCRRGARDRGAVDRPQFRFARGQVAGVHPDEQRRDGRVHRIHTAIQTQFTVGGGFELAPACRVHRTERLRRPIDR